MAIGFSIPGTIKNEYLPFRLMPGRQKGPQTFSFRNRGGAAAQLNICPASLRDPAFGSYFGMDIGNQLAYGAKATKGSTEQVTLDDIFNNIPAIQIREFLPDTKLDQCLNFFGNLVSQLLQKETSGKSVTELIKTATGMNPDVSANKSTDSWFKDPGGKIQKLIEKIFNWIEDKLPTIGSAEAGSIGGSADSKVLQFPYLLYYKLQTCTTTNYYELPCISEKNIVSSDGSTGWDGMNHFGVSFSNDSTGIMNKILKFLTGSIFNNIRVNFMPYWNATQGWSTREDDVMIQFDLFNDTEAAAIANFIFVNTIVPGARWLQYGMFQHSPNLYDIKLEGINRLFACTGTFSVKYGGQLRTPPDTLISKLNNKYGNGDGNSDNRIKIPDVYHVELKFKSILPKNFNTYIYQYSTTNNIFSGIQNYQVSGVDPSKTKDKDGKDKGAYQILSDKITEGINEITT